MMTKLKKTTTFLMVAIMLAGMTALAAPDDGEDAIKVSLRIEGVSEVMYYNTEIELAAGTSIAGLMEGLENLDGAPKAVINDSGYLARIGDLKEGAYGGWSGWSFRYNGEELTSGIGDYILLDGDEVVCYYGDPWGGPGMQYPIVDLSNLFTNNSIRFTSLDTDYSTDPPAVKENPIAGAKVTFHDAVYTTDENGEIAIADMHGISGYRALQIERYDEESEVPTVLRFAPDYMQYVPFSDMMSEMWYDAAVMFCVREWSYQGTNTEQNLFEPTREMNMAELLRVLALIADTDLSAPLFPDEPWFKHELEWAIYHGIISMEDFDATASVTKERYIYMFYLTMELTQKHDMTVRADISGAVDYGEINEEYHDAISWAVASGIVSGTSDTALEIDPAQEFTRAMVCQLLYNYL